MTNQSRFFVEIAYNGTRHAGWQRQPNAMTIQEEIETKLSTVLNAKTSIVGCGRTDAGVHASQYFFHFEFDGTLPNELAHRLNRMLNTDIVIKKIFPVEPSKHARFDATARSYSYFLSKNKSPFKFELETRYSQFHLIDTTLLTQAADLIKTHTEFYPFCKSNSDAETMTCEIMESHWQILSDEYIYHIQANRFLRGMVRLIVGMSIRVAIGEIKLTEVEHALINQTRIEKSWSAPATGLFLSQVKY